MPDSQRDSVRTERTQESKDPEDPTYDAICLHLAQEAPELAQRLLRRWDHIKREEPWLALPEGLAVDHLPDLISALAESARWRMERRDDREKLVHFAARHGEERSRAGHAEELLFREYHLLRRTLWEELRQEWGAGPETYQVILHVDAGITLSSSASLHGFHRAQYEDRDDWPKALDRLLDDWPDVS